MGIFTIPETIENIREESKEILEDFIDPKDSPTQERLVAERNQQRIFNASMLRLIEALNDKVNSL